MLPVLFTVGGYAIHTYGVAIGAALYAGIAGAVALGKRAGFPAGRLWDLGIVLLVGGVVGARLEYARTHWTTTYAAHPLRVLDFREGGLVFYGGLVGAIVCMVAYAAGRRMGVLRVLDVYAPFVPLGHALGRLGCFAAGCCYGAPTAVPWAVTFPPGSEAPPGVPLHPTQLYEAVYCGLLGLALLAWWPRRRGDGEVFAALLILYPAFRAVNEVFRGDAMRGTTVFGLSNAQATSILLGALGVGLLVFRPRADGRRAAPPRPRPPGPALPPP